MAAVRDQFSTALFVLRMIVDSSRSCDNTAIYLCNRLVTIADKLDALMASGDDSESIEGFEAASEEQARLIARISRSRTTTIRGLIAKAECALLKPIEKGYDGGIAIGLSVCEDLISLRL